jgi:hypothetical protein
MIRTFSALFLFLFFVSCGKNTAKNSSLNDQMIGLTDEEINSTSFAPVQAQTFDINVKYNGFDRVQEAKLLEAFDMLKRVIGSDEFKQKVLNHYYNGKKQYVDNEGLTNSQIYKKILEGAEKLSPQKNNAMDLLLQTYTERNIVIGYTVPNLLTIFMNTKYLNQTGFSANQVAMNIMHEWLHKLGFKHAVNNNPSRPYSVPYAIGYIIRELAAKI